MDTIIGRNDFYRRKGITLRDAIEFCRSLGLNPSRNLMFAADLLSILKLEGYA